MPRGRPYTNFESRHSRICRQGIVLDPVHRAAVRTCHPSTTMIGGARPVATAPAATRTETATVTGARAVAYRRPTTTTIAGEDIGHHPGARWMTILAAPMMTSTGVITLRRPTPMVMAGRMIDHQGTSLPGMPHTRGMGMGPGTMIGAVTGKSNHLLRAESLLNRRIRSCSATAAGRVVSWQDR